MIENEELTWEVISTDAVKDAVIGSTPVTVILSLIDEERGGIDPLLKTRITVPNDELTS